MSSRSPDFPRAVETALEQLQLVPDANGWPVSERLTAFFFVLLDALEALELPEEQALSDAFERDASGFTSDFQKALRGGLTDVMNASDIPLVNRVATDTSPSRFVVAEMLVQLISTSLKDDSKDRQRSSALADKVLAFAASVLTNPIPQKAVDVVRYSIEAGYLPINKIPFIQDWLKADEDS